MSRWSSEGTDPGPSPSFLTLVSVFSYSVFRLVFGTLYPAYSSYKAVKSRDLKEYVSTRAPVFSGWERR